ncbi:MAG: CTP synthase [Elusimicrobia bacterium]|nr:CTP synthase [Elusimicrobiota bacterium]MDE2424888.1 CTP synthase [Elusimicrobiota bacterium]
MTKFIFVTGGVVSSLGKGISASSIGKLMQARGLSVAMLKCDPYINVDPGTMNPFQHGEVFVTEDGAETDLDLGHYERFLNQEMHHINNFTAGKVYETVIARERRGDFLGSTVQVIPHITDEIKSRFRAIAKGVDVAIIEIGGTVGDIESLPFLEAARQMGLEHGRDNVLFLHVTLVPYIRASEELKTKPTQHSVGKLREIGISPDILICRTEKAISPELKAKIALFCSVQKESVIEAPDVESIYEVPLVFHKQGLDEQIVMLLRLRTKSRDLENWTELVRRLKSPRHRVKIAMAGKYTDYKDAYKSVNEALLHGGVANDAHVDIRFLDTSDPDIHRKISDVHGILVPGGFGDRGIDGKIRVAQLAREGNIPYFGLCLGLQIAVIEFARNVLKLAGAHSTEFDPRTKYPVIDLLPEQKSVKEMGASMRLGTYECALRKGSLAWKAYGRASVSERHRHRYEVNNKFRKLLEEAGLKASGIHASKDLVEIVELREHPWFLAVQFHPEFKSRIEKPHPLFASFIAAAVERARILEPSPSESSHAS